MPYKGGEKHCREGKTRYIADFAVPETKGRTLEYMTRLWKKGQ